MADNDDQSRSDNIFYMKKLHARSCTALGIDQDANSWFDIVDRLEAQERKLVEAQHELALLHDVYRLYPGAWCCKTAQASNGWHHISTCKNHVVCF